MYKFSLKDKGSGPEITITRALLALAGFASFAVQTSHSYFFNVVAGILLLLSAFAIKIILQRFGINRVVLITIASFIFFLASGSVSFGIVLLLIGLSIKLLFKEQVIEIGELGIKIPNLTSVKVHHWFEFNNVVLKDGLLTLDFKTNKLTQLTINEVDMPPEKHFNEFCYKHINPAAVSAE